MISFALLSALTAQILSQFLIKGIFSCIKNRRFSLVSFTKFTHGGMPSGHSALVSGLGFYLLFTQGFTDLTSVAFVAGLIVIVDSFKLRHDVQKALTDLGIKEYGSVEKIPFNTSLGHTFPEVIVGILVGVASAGLWYWIAIS